MSEIRFPNSDEIAALRGKGIVATSGYTCRLLSGTTALCFLWSSHLAGQFEDLLSLSALEDGALLTALISFQNTIVKALLIYIFTYVLLTLFQSRFYFGFGQIFKRQEAFFHLNRSYTLFRSTAIASVFGFFGFLMIVILIWKEFFLARLGLIEQASFSQIFDALSSICYKFGLVLALALLVTIFIAILYSRLNFLFLHRVKVKRG